MNAQEAIELLLTRMNSSYPLTNGFFGAMGGSAGNINVLQKDMNAALTAWREEHDPNGLKQMAATLQTMGKLTDTEYEQIMDTLDRDE